MPIFAKKPASLTRHQPTTGGVPTDIMRGLLHFWRGRQEAFWPEWVRALLDDRTKRSNVRPINVDPIPDHLQQGRRINKVLKAPKRPEGAAPDPFFDDGSAEG